MPYNLQVSQSIINFVATLSEEERGRFFRCLELIEADPHIDGEFKTTLLRLPGVFTVYYDGEFSIVYHMVIDETIHAFAACRGPYLPPVSDFRKR